MSDSSSYSEKNWREFFNTIEESITLHKSYEQISDIINQGMLTFLKYPSAESCLLFFLNNETFEFDFKSSAPYDVKVDVDLLYNKAIDNGILGESINAKFPKYANIMIDNAIKAIMVVPLVIPSKVFGIVILVLKEPTLAAEKFLQRLAMLQGSIFGNSLESNRLFKRFKKVESLLEQKIAVRTLGLSQSKRELQAILNSVQTGILVINVKTNEIITANPIAAEILKENQDSLIGKNSKEIFGKSLNEQHNLDTKIMFSRNFESTVICSDGDRIPVLRTISHIFLGNDKLRIESFIDISERKRIEESLKQANELLELKVQERTEDLQLLVHKLKIEISERERAEAEMRKMLEKEKELNELKTRFVSMVSHEFRTPLTIIRSSAQIIQKYKDKLNTEKELDYLERITSTVDLMTDILENVLFIGKSDSDKIKFHPAPINIIEFCINVINDINMVNQTFDEIVFRNNAKKEIVVADENILRHILINLLSNAIKYNINKKQIEFSLNTDEEKTEFIIKDQGIGIPAEDQDRIFEPFHRSENVGTISGTGLGMSVVLRSIKLHEGTISFSSQENKGTTFKVTIPALNFGENNHEKNIGS
jgi:PAS domain S-box-containing protein